MLRKTPALFWWTSLTWVMFSCDTPLPPIPEGIDIPLERAESAQRLLFDKGCADCHIIDGTGGKMGPSLMGLGSRADRSHIEAYIRNPQAVRRTSSMPRVPLTEEELTLMLDYLMAHH